MEIKDVIKYLKEHNKENYYLDYLLEEGCESKEWYEAILKEALQYKPKRVIDVGCSLGLFAYLFAEKGIKYVGIDEENYNRFENDKISFITANYYDIKEQFKNDVIISCLCVGYLIPIKDVLGKVLIVDDSIGAKEDFKCTAKSIILKDFK